MKKESLRLRDFERSWSQSEHNRRDEHYLQNSPMLDSSDMRDLTFATWLTELNLLGDSQRWPVVMPCPSHCFLRKQLRQANKARMRKSRITVCAEQGLHAPGESGRCRAWWRGPRERLNYTGSYSYPDLSLTSIT